MYTDADIEALRGCLSFIRETRADAARRRPMRPDTAPHQAEQSATVIPYAMVDTETDPEVLSRLLQQARQPA